MMFSYPFNKYGFWDKIGMPIKYFFYKMKAFKGLEICPWDCVNIHESIFAQFAFFCRAYPNYFLEQAICEENSFNQGGKSMNGSLFKEDWAYERINKYLRLHQIQEYVLYTRDLNQSKLDYIEEEWLKLFRMYDELCKDGSGFCEIKFEHYFYYDIQFWFEQGELMYEMKKTDRVDKKNEFNPLDIKDALDNLDVEYAKEILDLKGHIWN